MKPEIAHTIECFLASTVGMAACMVAWESIQRRRYWRLAAEVAVGGLLVAAMITDKTGKWEDPLTSLGCGYMLYWLMRMAPIKPLAKVQDSTPPDTEKIPLS